MIPLSLRPDGRQLVNSVKRALSVVLPCRPMVGGKAVLDREYAAGAWDYLRGIDELARFSVIVGYCHHLKPGAAILEIGCGEGILAERLDASRYASYLGVDISEEAISRASSKQNERIRFVADDATRFVPPHKQDIIAFNECLEYFDDPLATMRRFEPFLSEGGAFIVSMFNGLDTVRSRRIWKRLVPTYRVLAETRVAGRSGYAWTIRVLAPTPTKS